MVQSDLRHLHGLPLYATYPKWFEFDLCYGLTAFCIKVLKFTQKWFFHESVIVFQTPPMSSHVLHSLIFFLKSMISEWMGSFGIFFYEVLDLICEASISFITNATNEKKKNVEYV